MQKQLVTTLNGCWIRQVHRNFSVEWSSEISVTPPNFVELEIVDTDPGLKGDTAGTGGKPATLSTGAVVSSAVCTNRRSHQSGYPLW